MRAAEHPDRVVFESVLSLATFNEHRMQQQAKILCI